MFKTFVSFLTSISHKVAYQHIKGEVENLMMILFQI